VKGVIALLVPFCFICSSVCSIYYNLDHVAESERVIFFEIDSVNKAFYFNVPFLTF
jgi:hypothetical protein